MSFYNWITKNIILPASDLVLGRSIYKHLNFLEKSQWWTKNELEEFQNEKLCDIIKHAYENVPYYNEMFKERKLRPEDIKTSDDLVKLPILTKEIIRKNFPHNIVARNINKRQIVQGASSGSTGEPLQYYTSKDAYSFNVACALRGWSWAGYRLGDKYMKISQNPKEGVVNKIQDAVHRCVYVHSQSLTRQNIVDMVSRIRSSKVNLVRGYPSVLYVLADYIKENNITDIRPKAVTTTGEILFPYMRALIEEQFHCRVFDAYSGEGGANVSECSTHESYHISAEYAVTEFVSGDTKIEGSGEGEIVSTNLWNYAMPFIRYNVKDIGVISEKDQCICGRGLPLLAEVKGRDSDILVTPSGKRLIVHYFTGYFEYVDTVKQFQVIQEEIDNITLKIIPNEKFNPQSRDKIKNDVSTYIGDDVTLNIEIVDEIPLTRSGKRRFIISNINKMDKD